MTFFFDSASSIKSIHSSKWLNRSSFGVSETIRRIQRQLISLYSSMNCLDLPWIYFTVKNGSSVTQTGNGHMSSVKICVIQRFFNVSISVAAVKLPKN